MMKEKLKKTWRQNEKEKKKKYITVNRKEKKRKVWLKKEKKKERSGSELEKENKFNVKLRRWKQNEK